MTTVYLNGEFLPLEQAQISVMDRGFLFGDGVYEVIPVFGGRCFRLDEHLDRLDRSLRETRIRAAADARAVAAVFARVDRALRRRRSDDLCAGHARRRRCASTNFPPGMQPTVFAFDARWPPVPEQAPAPIACITVDDIRWQRCDIKSVFRCSPMC